ncbi:MAG: hypothetical protein LKG27_04780 [Clostridiaceae bacterium]|jgi:hypothetical protein|nr:hypothetical protein [Clostridiaceae bacterium]
MADVNAIQPATPEQKSSKMGPAVASTVVLGGLGAAGGYFMGGKRPSLEEVFKQQPDKFVAKEVTDIDADSAKKLSDAVVEYNKAGSTELGELQNANKAYVIKRNEKEVDQALTDKLAETRKAFNDKSVTIDDKQFKVEDIKNSLKTAREKVASATTDEDKKAAKEALDKAKANAKKFNEATTTERKAVIDAKKAITKARQGKFDEAAKVADSAEKKLVDEVADKTKAYSKAKTDKLSEILGKDEIKTAFEKIKKAFPKEGKGKAAAIYGGIAAAVGLIAGLMMGGKKPVEAAPADAAQPAPEAAQPAPAPVAPAPADVTAQAPAPTAPATPEPAKA